MLCTAHSILFGW